VPVTSQQIPVIESECATHRRYNPLDYATRPEQQPAVKTEVEAPLVALHQPGCSGCMCRCSCQWCKTSLLHLDIGLPVHIVEMIDGHWRGQVVTYVPCGFQFNLESEENIQLVTHTHTHQWHCMVSSSWLHCMLRWHYAVDICKDNSCF
jgi:hypothetical protein